MQKDRCQPTESLRAACQHKIYQGQKKFADLRSQQHIHRIKRTE